MNKVAGTVLVSALVLGGLTACNGRQECRSLGQDVTESALVVPEKGGGGGRAGGSSGGKGSGSSSSTSKGVTPGTSTGGVGPTISSRPGWYPTWMPFFGGNSGSSSQC